MWNVPFYRRASTLTELMVFLTIFAILLALMMLLERLGRREAEATKASGSGR